MAEPDTTEQAAAVRPSWTLRHIAGLLLITAGIQIGGDRVVDRLLDDLLDRYRPVEEGDRG